MIDDLEVLLQTAVNDVCRTMLKIEPRTVPMDKETMGEGPHIAGSVGFIGQMTGVVYVYLTAAFANRVTATLLGLSENEIDGDDMVNDAIGEVANMITGNLKAALVDRGWACVLTIPSIVRGNSFSIEAVSSTTRRVLCFRCHDGEHLVVEVLIKPPE